MSKDMMPLNFGKYKGKTPEQIAEIDSRYIVWMYENINPKPCSRDLYDACEMDCVYEDEKERDACYGLDGW